MKKIKNVAIVIGLFIWFTFEVKAQNPVASFTTNQTSGCAPLSVLFTNTSVNAVSYYWEFGNGNTSVLKNPSNVFNNAGTYTVKLVIVGSNGQKDSVVSNSLITVSSNSTPDFHAVNQASCLDGNLMSFINTSTNATNYLWDFGDGVTSTLLNPNHTYASAGNYTIKLVTYDSYGCPSIKIITNYIEINPNPVTDFSVNTNVSCEVSQVFNFTSATSSVNSWLWDFGDGNSSTLQNPSHFYASPGTYNVTLVSTNSHGCSNSLTQYGYILIATPQIPLFSADTTSGCFPLAVTFTDSSYNAVSWLWDFGDGSTSTDQIPFHTFQNSGNYNVGLTITTDNGCVYTNTVNSFITIANKAVSSFSLSNTSGCAPVNVHFINQSTNAVNQLWEFGDGYTSTLQNPSHAYPSNGSYNVLLHSYNVSGCEAVSVQTNAVVIKLPDASFNSDYIPGCAPLTASFTNTSTNSVQWLWSFGDGTFSSLKNPSHTYNLPGDYTVSLIASNLDGCSDTTILYSYIHVINVADNYVTPPTVTACAPFNTSFSVVSQGAVSWLWDFGDGTTSTQQNPFHTYVASGFYTVSLTVHLNSGCIQFYPNFRTFTIKGGQVEFTFIPPTQCSPYLVNFTSSIQGNDVSWLWDFGDGQTSTLQNPTHLYSNDDFYYTVKHTVTTVEGCSSTIIKNNCLHFVACNSNGDTTGGGGENGSIGYNVSLGTNNPPPSLSSCIPFVVHFNNTLANTVFWLWDFGDGNTSTLQNPFHTYTTSGNYTIKLVAQHSNGTKDSIIYPNYIQALGLNIDFSFTSNGNCENTTVTFLGTSPTATQWQWNFGDGSTSSLQNPTHTYSGATNNYSITLTTSNAQNCSASISKNPLSTGNSPIINASDYETCANQQVNFNCFSSNFNTYLWNFGDGSTSALQNPIYSYPMGGSFQVTLTAIDNNGCAYNASLQNLINVSNPVAKFSYTLANSCSSKIVNFSNASLGVSLPLSAHCKWNFGDGSLEQWALNPTHTYTSYGVYQVTLTVNDGNNCFNTTTKTVHVHPITANFSYTQNTTCFPITITCSDSSSNSAVSWLWDFGDGNTSALQNPTHVFTQAPSTDITLMVTDASGCSATISKLNIAFFQADMGISVAEGCAPMYTEFYDASLNASQWTWDFGDGTTSTLQNPTHTYLNNGTFIVTLISKSISGCVDTVTFEAMNINKPIANFISQNPTNCSPALVSFSDLSSNAVSWLWDFGDGSNSTIQSPGHVYNIPGFYTIKLTVTNNTGCVDSLIRINYIEVPGSIANFTASANQTCVNTVVQFTDASINAASWNWNFGDGNTSTQKNPSNIYSTTGQYTVSLIVHDVHGCSSNFTLQNTIQVNPLPTADFIVSDTVSCTPFSIAFQNQSQNALSYSWNFGDGGSSSLSAPTHTYINSGIYTANLIATNQFGCTSTKSIHPIIAKKTPVVDFNVSATKGCSPLTITFTDLSINTQSANYLWDFGNGTTSTQQNPTTTITTPGIYSVSLKIINNTGCGDTLIKTAFIEVYDLNPPPQSPIKAVTVVSNTSTAICWNVSTVNDFSYYEIFRQEFLTGNYISLGTINNRTITTFSDDHNLNTLTHSYCYKIQTVDICGYRLPLDSLQEHCTINVSALGLNNSIKVNWTPYVGANVSTYDVYRMEVASTIAVWVATVPSNTLTIIDTAFFCPFDYSYRIKANNLNGNAVSSNSDTSIAKPIDSVLLQQKVEVVRSTVINNSNVLTEWKTPLIAPEKIIGYAIYRSTDNANFTLLTTASAVTHEYIDNDVDVNTKNYFYKIKAVNVCDIDGVTSNKSSSILLKAELEDSNVLLNWTGYDGWNMGVDYYIIEKKNENGTWETIKKVDGNTTIYQTEE
jgi:PKD repeat protein